MSNSTIDLGSLSKQYSSRDLPSHVKLKYRESGQNAPEETKKDKKELRRELEEKEKSSKDNNKRSAIKDEIKEDKSSKKQKVEAITINLDADEQIIDNDNESNDEDEEEDDTAELLAELERIKKERANEATKLEAERQKQEEKVRVENILKGNPLLNLQKTDFKVKRRWDDDVVFKNCAKGEDKIVKKGFVNDTLRSDFHKKFMDKYIK